MKNRDEAKLVNTGWAQMKATLDEVMPEEKKKPIFLPYIIGFGGVITIFGLWLLLNGSHTSVIPAEKTVENLESPSVQSHLRPEIQASTPTIATDNSSLVLTNNEKIETGSSYLSPEAGSNSLPIQKSNYFRSHHTSSALNQSKSAQKNHFEENTKNPVTTATSDELNAPVIDQLMNNGKNDVVMASTDIPGLENTANSNLFLERRILQLPTTLNPLQYDHSFEISPSAVIADIQPVNAKRKKFSLHGQAQVGSSSFDLSDLNYAAGLAVKWKPFKKMQLIPSLMVTREKYNTNFVYSNGQYRLENKGTHNGDSRDNQYPPFGFNGVEFSNLSVSNGYYLTYNTQILMSAGLNVGYALSKRWAFETGLNYTFTPDQKNTHDEISNALNFQSTGANNAPPTALYSSKSYQPIRYNFGMYYSPARWLEVGLTFQRAVRPLIEISQNQNAVSSVNPPFVGLNARVKIL